MSAVDLDPSVDYAEKVLRSTNKLEAPISFRIARLARLSVNKEEEEDSFLTSSAKCKICRTPPGGGGRPLNRVCNLRQSLSFARPAV